MDIHFLGTGSAYPGSERDNTSFCITTPDYSVLVDVSGNPCRKLKQKHVSLIDLDAVIITHFHIDHIYGLPSLLWGMWLEHRKKPLQIFCDMQCEEKLNEWLHVMGVNDWGVEFPLSIQTFSGVESLIKTRELNISCFPAIHSVPTIGLEIVFQDKLIVYSGDSEVNHLIQAYEAIDLLIHEATFARKQQIYHASVEQIVQFYDLNTIKQLVFVHLSDLEPYEEIYQELPAEYQEKFRFAYDMDHLSIN